MIKSIKYLLIAGFISTTLCLAEEPPSNKATGFFIAFGVGPRIPLGEFSNTTDLGYGLNLEFSYTDNEFLPIFLFANLGYEQYPGSQSYLQETDYSNYHTNSIPVNIGARYYFAPLLENIILLMPIVQASASYSYYETLHEFDQTSGKNNYLDKESKFGVSAGAGISMFMMELLATYNYMPSNQFISVDLKVRIPLYMSF